MSRFDSSLRGTQTLWSAVSCPFGITCSHRPNTSPDRDVPTCAADLDDHEIIVYGEDMATPVSGINWILEAGASSPRRPALTVSSVYGIYRAVKSGFGIAALPYYLTEESPDLVEVLPDLHGPTIDAFFVYPEELRHSRRIAAVRDFLLDEAGGRERGLEFGSVGSRCPQWCSRDPSFRMEGPNRGWNLKRFG